MENERSGKLYTLADKAADLTILGLLWMVTSLPIITFGTSCTALYYTVAKSIRYGKGKPVREYFRAWRGNAVQGCIITLFYLLFGGIILTIAKAAKGQGVFLIILVPVILLTSSGIYLFPLLSRFTLSVWKYFQVSVFFAIKYAPKTGLLLFTYLLCVLVFCIFPFLLPILISFYTLYSTYLIEGIFKEYIDPSGIHGGEWYMGE